MVVSTPVATTSDGGGISIPVNPSAVRASNGASVPLAFSINQGEKTVSSPMLTLHMNADPLTVKGYIVSLDKDFTGVLSINSYTPTASFTLPKKSGEYTIYLKYYSVTGIYSNVLSRSVNYKPTSTYVFKRTLQLGSKGVDVKQLQIFLNTHGYIVSQNGADSPGNETTIFDQATKTALARLQTDHPKEILIPQGLKAKTGIFANFSRAYVNGVLAKEARQ